MTTSKKEVFIPPRNKSDMTGNLRKLIKDKRVSIYIDSANLYFASNIAKIRIDFIHLAHWFRQNSRLTGINFYTAFDPEETKQLQFIDELKQEGYRLVTKPIKVFENSKKGNMDIELAVDCITQKDLYDVVILLSGDGDFSYLIQALDSMGKDTIILGVGGFTSYELHQEADNYFFLNRIMDVWSNRQKKKSRVKTASLPGKKEVIDQDETERDRILRAEAKHVPKVLPDTQPAPKKATRKKATSKTAKAKKNEQKDPAPSSKTQSSVKAKSTKPKVRAASSKNRSQKSTDRTGTNKNKPQIFI